MLAAVAAALTFAAPSCGSGASVAPSAHLVNKSPLCRGVRLLSDRTRDRLGVYVWRPAAGGPRPVPSGLNGSDAVKAELQPAAERPGDYVVVLTFAQGDAELLLRITEDASSAVPAERDVPAPGHLAIFLGLTDRDLAAWPAVSQRLTEPLAQGGKLVDDPVSLEPVTDGRLSMTVRGDPQTACSLTAEKTP
jgi:hypothetical protein